MNILEEIKKEVSSDELTVYNEFTAKLTELQENYGTEVPDASTKAGYQRAKSIAQECTKVRTATESTRKAFKSPVLELGKKIDSHAKGIIAKVSAIEEPFKAAYKAVDDEKKRIKAEREERILEI